MHADREMEVSGPFAGDGDPHTVMLRDDSLSSTLLSALNGLRRRRQFCDLEVRKGNAVLQAHKAVVAAGSPYFLELLSNQEPDSNKVELADPKLDVEALDTLIEFLYTSVLRLSRSTVEQLCYAALVLKMERIQLTCCKFMWKHLDLDNCVRFFRFARYHSCPELQQKCQEFMAAYLLDVTQRQEGLTPHDLATIMEMEDALRESRMSTFPVLIAAGGMTTGGLTDAVEKYDPMSGMWSTFTRLPKKKSHGVLVAYGRRLYSIGGNDGIRRLTEVDIYDMEIEEWTEGPRMTTARSGFAVAVGNFGIYCIGGFDGSQNIKTVEVLDLRTNRWTQGPDLVSPRSYMQAAVLDCCIYTVGGTDGRQRLRSVEKLRPCEGSGSKWRAVADMNCPRSRAGVVSMGEYLYVVGGYDGSSYLNSIERYSPAKDSWELLTARLSVPRNSPSVCTLNDVVVIVGGHDGKRILETAETIDFTSSEWKQLPPMLTPRCDSGLAVLSPISPRSSTWI